MTSSDLEWLRTEQSVGRRKAAGFVYVITNPSHVGWVSVGTSNDYEKRLTAYNRASPHRDYSVQFARLFSDKFAAEREAHHVLSALGIVSKGEWFKTTPDGALRIIEQLPGGLSCEHPDCGCRDGRLPGRSDEDVVSSCGRPGGTSCSLR